LIKARENLKGWCGADENESWLIYQRSPEMKIINTALAKHEETDK